MPLGDIPRYILAQKLVEAGGVEFLSDSENTQVIEKSHTVETSKPAKWAEVDTWLTRRKYLLFIRLKLYCDRKED